nr:helix-turn-helix transcriptional regulator [uncultured Oscillibacter sp.]
MLEKNDFIKRLVDLRIAKGVSARDMSLSIGQSAGYINNIENGVNYPSMTAFFYICDYLGISPKEFFDTETANPTKAHALVVAAQGLSDEQLDNLISIAKGLNRR